MPMKTLNLWNFALACYARPGVEAACMELQAAGADVCVWLCGAWLETRGILSSPERVEQLQAVARDWRTEVVEPLRTLRQAWREPGAADADLETLRGKLKQLELDAERILLHRLELSAQGWMPHASQSAWLEQLAVSAVSRDTALECLRSAAALTHLELLGS